MTYDRVKLADNLVIGTKQTARAVEQGKVVEVIVSRDADMKITVRVLELCRRNGVTVTYVDSKRLLGKACGIEVGAAIVAIVDLTR